MIDTWGQRGWIHLPYFFDSKWIGDSSLEIQWQTSTGAPPEASPHPTDGTPELKPSDGKSDYSQGWHCSGVIVG